ncbi:hypothetical protein GUITHDRAFT_148786 [Guillardia theta CCMP2712]|uniref:Uncharacterized protein n=1 Tax=Guillardia theta (strain CCMP2712) TaxID=905079 RepID=L1I8N0_GUITC|nr:hypothetical protein GUITHDRAFT_148786 [Guillardia theta CCMP2712]EKX32205.1 hypothetical protein GUITHDRAFT_148786 [Guillardia theta CCMP2712]|eukprot:XP_005819185.1 hypothetical protein GUITHDRAFT_148786 [Guillardia theta CCMP2712]
MDSKPMLFHNNLRRLARTLVHARHPTNSQTAEFVEELERLTKTTYEGVTGLSSEDRRRCIDIATENMWLLRYLELYTQTNAARFKRSTHDYVGRLLNLSLDVVF